MEDITKNFQVFLENKGVSPRTQKNYLSDMRYFIRWVEKSGISAESADKSGISWFNQVMIAAFRNSLIHAQIPRATINRRLSSLRQFGDFLISQGWLQENPAKIVSSISYLVSGEEDIKKWKSVLTQFKQALKIQGQSKTTVKNYLGDVRQFLKWARTQDFSRRGKF